MSILLALCLVPGAASADPALSQRALRSMAGEEGAGLEELRERLRMEPAGLEEPADRRPQNFLKKISEEIYSQEAKLWLDLLAEFDDLERRLDDPPGLAGSERREAWDGFRRIVARAARTLETRWQSGRTYRELAQRMDSDWAADPQWVRFERRLRYGVREGVQQLYGLTVTLSDPSIPPEELGQGLERDVYRRAIRETLEDDLFGGIARLRGQQGIPSVPTRLSDEEWERLLRLQDRQWEFFSPIGPHPLPSLWFRSGDVQFHPSRLVRAAELMKAAGVGGSSHVWDLGAGVGSALSVAAVIFGAQGTGVEMDEDLADRGRRWIEHLEGRGMLESKQVALERGDLFRIPPDDRAGRAVTHLYVFPILSEEFRERLDRWVADEISAAAGTRLIVNDFDNPSEGLLRGLWPQLSSKWRLNPGLSRGVIFEKIDRREMAPDGGLEEVQHYSDVVRQLNPRQDWFSHLRLWGHPSPLGFWQINRPVLVTWDDLEAAGEGGIRIVDQGALYGLFGNQADWYVDLRLRSAVYRDVIVEVRAPEGSAVGRRLPVGRGGTSRIGGIATQWTERGVVIRPGEDGSIYLQHLPGAFGLTLEEESRLAELWEEVERQAVDQWMPDKRALLETDPETRRVVLEGAWQGIFVERVPARLGDPGQEGPSARWKVVIPRGGWSEEELELLIGPFDRAGFSEEVPIRLAGESRPLLVRFTSQRDHGRILLHSEPRRAEELTAALRLMARLVAKLIPSRGGDPAYRRRFLETAALAYDTDFQQVEGMLSRYRHSQEAKGPAEPSAPIRQAGVRHLYRRHQEHPALKFSPEQKLRVRTFAAGLLAGGREAEFQRDPSEFVRLEAVHLFTRVTPNEPAEIDRTLAVLETVMDSDSSAAVRSKTGDALQMLLVQKRQGQGPSIGSGQVSAASAGELEGDFVLRRFRGNSELLVDGTEVRVSDETRGKLGLAADEEAIVVTVPDALGLPPDAGLYLHADLIGWMIGYLPEEILNSAIPLRRPEDSGDAESRRLAQAEARRVLSEREAGQDDFAIFNRRHVPMGEEMEWVPQDEVGRAQVPAAFLPEESAELTEREIALLRIVALLEADFTLSVRALKQIELDGKTALVLYL